MPDFNMFMLRKLNRFLSMNHGEKEPHVTGYFSTVIRINASFAVFLS